MIIAAALCPAPPLLARELTGRDPVLPELRRACREATARLLAARPDAIVVIGAATRTRIWDPASRLDLAAFAQGRAGATDEGPALTAGLPSSVGLGAMLLDQAGYAGQRILQAVGADEAPAGCAGIGARLARSAERIALLVMADGSARRSPRAPGHLDERSAGFDSEVERAVRAGELTALLDVDPVLAGELMATGRPAWQVLAGAMDAGPAGEMPSQADVLYAGDPFGVAYLVASFSVFP